ncbi:MAG TPA: ABC transporter substrate-binding protein [bacterium]|nr:ABC transporter substrate-binding protein [bacterium]
MRRVATAMLLAALLAGLPVAGGEVRPIVIGAVYPAEGPQAGPGGGLDEYHGLLLAAAYVNARGGAGGRAVRVRLASAASPDAAPSAVEQLAEGGVPVIIGTYGSVIARPAAEAAAQRGLVYWETGAVGEIAAQAWPGVHFFRVAPSGAVLGRAAVDFVRDRLAPRLHHPGPLRYGVVYVDDAFGRAEARGEIAEIRRSGLPLAAALPYNPWHANYVALAARIAGSRTDVLVVAAYMENAVALRRAVIAAKVPLAVNIGGCSAYIMPEFGRRLGGDAVGVFSSDKTGDLLPARALTPAAAQALLWARAEFQRRYGHPLWEPALSGFTGGLALFSDVLPAAREMSAAGIAAAALKASVPVGGLPNGAGLAFGAPGTGQAGENLRAASVIWEWVAPNTRALVWPPQFATHAVVLP